MDQNKPPSLLETLRKSAALAQIFHMTSDSVDHLLTDEKALAELRADFDSRMSVAPLAKETLNLSPIALEQRVALEISLQVAQVTWTGLVEATKTVGDGVDPYIQHLVFEHDPDETARVRRLISASAILKVLKSFGWQIVKIQEGGK